MDNKELRICICELLNNSQVIFLNFFSLSKNDFKDLISKIRKFFILIVSK